MATCIVKAIAALASRALRSGSRFPPHDHPFVQALASGADVARAELTRQAARMVAYGVDGVVEFLRPFLMLAVVRKGDAPFARDLIGALAAAAKPGVVNPVLKLLEEIAALWPRIWRGTCRGRMLSWMLSETGDMVPANTIGMVLKCLSKAPRLPTATTDWGLIVRQCVKIEAQVPQSSTSQQNPKLLREACLYFSLVHAKTISPLLQSFDDLTDVLRFQRLDIDVQSILFQHLSHLMKLFFDSRFEKLYEDLTEYLYSSTSSFLNYSSEQ